VGLDRSIIDTDSDTDRDRDRVEKNEKNRNNSDINDDDECVYKGVRKGCNGNGTHIPTTITTIIL